MSCRFAINHPSYRFTIAIPLLPQFSWVAVENFCRSSLLHADATVYQKVVPEPIFALLLELTSLTGEGPGGPGGISVPPQPAASLADIDDGFTASPTGDSQGSGMSSGNEWEKVNEN